MPPKSPERQKKLKRPEAGLHTWPSLQRVLERERTILKQIRSSKGLDTARAEQEKRLVGLNDMDTMEQMFIEGRLRHPEGAKYIEGARKAYEELLIPLLPAEEERMNKLEYIHKYLLKSLWKLQKQVQESLQNDTRLVITVDLESAHAVLQEYADLSGASPRVIRLVGEIKIILNDLDRLAKQFSG